MSKRIAILAVSVLLGAAPHAVRAAVPTVDQILSLHRVGSPAISPDGLHVAYTVRDTDWDANEFRTQIWMADTTGGAPRQLTYGPTSSSSPDWSPDGRTLAFLSERSKGDRRQIYLMPLDGGEPRPLTTAGEGVNRFAWSPDGRSIAYTSTDAESEAIRTRTERYGEFTVVGHDDRMAQLYVVDVAGGAVRQLTHGPFVVGSFDWSPDGRAIAFDHEVNSSPASSGTTDIAIVDVADGHTRDLVTQDGPDSHPVWSPDGTRIAFESSMASPSFYYTNEVIATIPAGGGTIRYDSKAFDEDASLVGWKKAGIYFQASHHTAVGLYRLDPATDAVSRLTPSDGAVDSSFSLDRDATSVAFVGADAKTFPEIYAAPVATMLPRRLTDMNAQIAGWDHGTLEVVSWKSRDGATVEGVLHKPADFQPGRRYPLLVVIHGGPTGTSRPIPYSSSIYPVDIWVPRGVLVLEPNYRGSAGYGQAFRSLNVRNLGIGDAWDVLSGVDYLIAQGLVDRDKVGAMGWSEGGYISAFLTTHDSDRFKAISVGAGISDWTTYYVNTDIHPFTRQYLKATPWDDPEIYAKTSPITYIKQAKTPTLIQHGATDQRVPLPDAFELYRGLQDEGVPSKLIVYKGFEGIGHGPSKPKSDRATMEHNLEWFKQYLFDAGAAYTPR
jgi:dipeptidyl aminopeptidase/acylaminoacyl peptidase